LRRSGLCPRAFTKEGLEWGAKRAPERELKEWVARKFGAARSKHEAGSIPRRFMSFACTFGIACDPERRRSSSLAAVSRLLNGTQRHTGFTCAPIPVVLTGGIG
jgi:hypothetical protein